MKKIMFWTLLGAMVLLPACQSANEKELKVRLAELELSDGQNRAAISIDLPEGSNKQLNQAIMEYVNEMLGGSYKGALTDGDSLIRFYAQGMLDELKDMHSDVEDNMEYTNEATMRKGYENGQIVTYEVGMETFAGGAHGYGIAGGVTFRKSDGRRIDKNILPANIDENSEWKKLMKEGMKAYFDVKTDDEMQEMLDVDINDLPMPESNAYFTAVGMVLPYQSYEIACYASGRPETVIPYDKLEQFVNATGREIFYNDKEKK